MRLSYTVEGMVSNFHVCHNPSMTPSRQGGLRKIKTMAAIHDPKHKNELVMRLRRVEGQLRGIQAMIAAGEDCEKVAQQIAAGRKALDKAFFNVLACAIQAEPEAAARSAKPSAEGRLAHAAELLAKFG